MMVHVLLNVTFSSCFHCLFQVFVLAESLGGIESLCNVPLVYCNLFTIV